METDDDFTRRLNAALTDEQIRAVNFSHALARIITIILMIGITVGCVALPEFVPLALIACCFGGLMSLALDGPSGRLLWASILSVAIGLAILAGFHLEHGRPHPLWVLVIEAAFVATAFYFLAITYVTLLIMHILVPRNR